MLSPEQEQWYVATFQEALKSGHIFPEMATCEAAVETAWGTSKCCVEGKNIFGEKQHAVPIFETVYLPTEEWQNGRMVGLKSVAWVKYPTLADCFADRMATLRRLSAQYPAYAAALAASSPELYVINVSRSWSTDPARSVKCIEIYDAHAGLLKPAAQAAVPR
jgi:flagellum-specific peptidoglycan hydrolase FlgJ